MSLVKRGNSKFWYVQFQIDHQTIVRSTKTTDRRVAEQVAAKIRADVHAELLLGKGADHLGDCASSICKHEGWNRELPQSGKSDQDHSQRYRLLDSVGEGHFRYPGTVSAEAFIPRVRIADDQARNELFDGSNPACSKGRLSMSVRRRPLD